MSPRRRIETTDVPSQNPEVVRRDSFGRYQGGFYPDGNWNADGDWCSPLDMLVRRLCERRRLTQHAPNWYAEVIRSSDDGKFVQAITESCLSVWLECPEWQAWRHMPASTAAAESIKRGGLGTQVPGEWAGGYWMRDNHPRLREFQDRASELELNLNWGYNLEARAAFVAYCEALAGGIIRP